ncbi:MAG: hypothetical protein U1D30_13795 [Planctomycetota bacterium]
MTNKELRELLEYFGREQACYTSLLDLSRRQKQVISGGNVDDLLKILGQKQQILSRVAEVENLLSPYKRNWRAVRMALDDNDRQVLDMALATVEELLAELIALERESEQLLVARRDACQQELSEAVDGGNVHHAYSTPASPGDSRFFDVRSD